MKVFVLSTGRCGSTTFVRACKHLSNFSAAHESRHGLLGLHHMSYPDNHIEADNRLSWFLGALDEHYGESAFYVHLYRDPALVARSYLERYEHGIIRMHDYSIVNAYARNLLGRGYDKHDPYELCLDYCETVNQNIALFLKDKNRKMKFSLENSKDCFYDFWHAIGGQGDFDQALAEWDIQYNKNKHPSKLKKIKRKLKYLNAIFFE